MSVGTAFFERQRELNTKLSWGDWSGYHAAAVFADFVDIEYNAVREAAAVIDVTPLYKYEVERHRCSRAPRPRRDPGHLGRWRLDQVIYTPVVRRGGQGHRRRDGDPAGTRTDSG